MNFEYLATRLKEDFLSSVSKGNNESRCSKKIKASFFYSALTKLEL